MVGPLGVWELIVVLLFVMCLPLYILWLVVKALRKYTREE